MSKFEEFTRFGAKTLDLIIMAYLLIAGTANLFFGDQILGLAYLATHSLYILPQILDKKNK